VNNGIGISQINVQEDASTKAYVRYATSGLFIV